MDLGLASIAGMHEGHGDLLWDAFALLMLAAGPLLRTAMAANA